MPDASRAPLTVTRFVMPASHPSLPGHFPGHPIVPGVVLLDAVLAVAARALPDRTITGLDAAKFSRPVAPDESVLIQLAPPDGCSVRFSGVVADVAVLTGSLRIS